MKMLEARKWPIFKIEWDVWKDWTHFLYYRQHRIQIKQIRATFPSKMSRLTFSQTRFCEGPMTCISCLSTSVDHHETDRMVCSHGMYVCSMKLPHSVQRTKIRFYYQVDNFDVVSLSKRLARKNCAYEKLDRPSLQRCHRVVYKSRRIILNAKWNLFHLAGALLVLKIVS